MEEDLNELFVAYLAHFEELRQDDYFVKGSSKAFYNLHSKFLEKYDYDQTY